MELFELRRLRQEGKNVCLPGGRCALDQALSMEFEEADKRLELWAEELQERKRDELKEMTDASGLTRSIDLGC